MASVESLSDSELRHKLAEYGFPAGPVTDTSRKVLVKKLKLLMTQGGRSSDVSGKGKWRRSSSHFSSGEEESENDDKKTRLQTSMPPPSSNYRSPRRKSTGRLSDYPVTSNKMGRRKEINFRNDLFSTPKTSTPKDESNKKRQSRFSSPSMLTSHTSNDSSSRIHSSHYSRPSYDGFETGSDSDIDQQNNWKSSTTIQGANTSNTSDSVPYSSSFLSRLSSIRPRNKSDSSGGESNSVNTLLGFRKPQTTTSTAKTSSSWSTARQTNQPFHSSFVKRLSGFSSSFGSRGSTPSSIFDVKESDNSPNGFFSPSRWSGVSSQSDLSQEFKTTEDEAKFGCASQLVSMLLVVVAILFFAILAIIYLNVRTRDSINFGLESNANHFPLCVAEPGWKKSVSQEEMCVSHSDLVPAVKLVKFLHPELNQRAINQQCYGGQTAMMTHHEVVKWLLKKEKIVDGHELEHQIRGLKVLLLSNPHWGMTVVDSQTLETADDLSNRRRLVDTGGIVIPNPDLPLLCYLKIKVQGFLFYLLIVLFVLLAIFGIRRAILWYLRRKEQEHLEVLNMVKRIYEILVCHQNDSSPGKQNYLIVNHVRDQLIPPPDRKRLTKIWDQSVQWIKVTESRVRCEKQEIAGEELLVWRWLPESMPSRTSSSASSEMSSPRRNNKVWQGQAFDTMVGSPNSLPCSPTPCLKIRHMFKLDMEFGDEWPIRVQDAILEKCGEEGVKPLHISVDRTSREGCVYLKCSSQEDAGKAYRALHGWWFDCNLVTVKYLRLERYHERFPEAEGATIPLHPSNNQKLSLQRQSPLESN